MATGDMIDVRRFFPTGDGAAAAVQRDLSTLARGLTGSEILRIAAEIRELKLAGKTICNLTVGDFAPAEFAIPSKLESDIVEALRGGATNYPPSDGLLELRLAVARYYERDLGLSYPVESIVIAGGARPIIYATYTALVDRGEKVLYPIPSWNNNHYAFLTGAEKIEVPVGPESNFLPTAALLEPLLSGVRLVAINTPLNPTGTVMAEGEVRAIAQLVVDENRRRVRRGERTLFLMWDHIYWMLTFGDARHWTPPQLVPESAAWTVFVDGISKAFAATGLRVGWTVAPPHVSARMRDILGHVGAWAPKPEQVATARLLGDPDGIRAYHETMIAGARLRLDLLHDGFAGMKRDGLPVDSTRPQGAIYLSARFDLFGRRYRGAEITTNEQIRQFLLEEAGFAVVPFQAFGLREETGWMRLSIGAVSPAEIAEGLARVRAAVSALVG